MRRKKVESKNPPTMNGTENIKVIENKRPKDTNIITIQIVLEHIIETKNKPYSGRMIRVKTSNETRILSHVRKEKSQHMDATLEPRLAFLTHSKSYSTERSFHLSLGGNKGPGCKHSTSKDDKTHTQYRR